MSLLKLDEPWKLGREISIAKVSRSEDRHAYQGSYRLSLGLLGRIWV